MANKAVDVLNNRLANVVKEIETIENNIRVENGKLTTLNSIKAEIEAAVIVLNEHFPT